MVNGRGKDLIELAGFAALIVAAWLFTPVAGILVLGLILLVVANA